MVTPFDADGAVDVPTLERYVDWQIESGIHGLIPLGSTGEFMSMSDDEIALVAQTVIDRAAGRVPVLIGTTAEDTRAAVRLSRRAEAQGADGVMVLPPFYCTPTDDELFLHYRTISDAIGIPIMVYNNPAVANVDLKPALVARLSQIDNCRYIKESTLEVTRVRDIMRLSEGRMAVFGGIMGFESYVEGAVGWAAVPSNGAPREMARLYDLVMAGQLAEARALVQALRSALGDLDPLLKLLTGILPALIADALEHRAITGALFGIQLGRNRWRYGGGRIVGGCGMRGERHHGDRRGKQEFRCHVSRPSINNFRSRQASAFWAGRSSRKRG
eukprot:gene30115-39987_t